MSVPPSPDSLLPSGAETVSLLLSIEGGLAHFFKATLGFHRDGDQRARRKRIGAFQRIRSPRHVSPRQLDQTLNFRIVKLAGEVGIIHAVIQT